MQWNHDWFEPENTFRFQKTRVHKIEWNHSTLKYIKIHRELFFIGELQYISERNVTFAILISWFLSKACWPQLNRYTLKSNRISPHVSRSNRVLLRNATPYLLHKTPLFMKISLRTRLSNIALVHSGGNWSSCILKLFTYLLEYISFYDFVQSDSLLFQVPIQWLRCWALIGQNANHGTVTRFGTAIYSPSMDLFKKSVWGCGLQELFTTNELSCANP